MSKASRQKQKEEVKKGWLYWIPVLVVLLFVPIITRYISFESRIYGETYYPDVIGNEDAQLFMKAIVMQIVAIGAALLAAYAIWKNRWQVFEKKFCVVEEYRSRLKVLLPLGIYIILAFLSSIISSHRYAAFAGVDDQFEPFFAVFGYVFMAAYIFFLVKDEEDFNRMMKIMFGGMAILALYGILQYTGNDLFNFYWFQSLVAPGGNITSQWEENRVVLATYNPNYAGVLLALLSALCFGFVLTERSVKRLIAGIVLLLALVTSLIGTGSRAGLLVFVVAAGLAVLFQLKKLMRFWYLLIPACTFVILSALLFIQYQDLPVFERVKSGLSLEKQEENPLERLVTTAGGIEATYNGVSFKMAMEFENGEFYFGVEEEDGTKIPFDLDEDGETYRMQHEQLSDVTWNIGILEGMYPVFNLHMNGHDWMFAMSIPNVPGCYYLNPFNTLTALKEKERFGFYGYEHFASGRGFLWSQTLPLLKSRIILGEGSNNFVFAYPQTNYVDMYYFSGEPQLPTRPHCMYLQMAVESGVLSVLALIVFWAWYLLSSIPLYFKSNYKTWTERVGFACFLAVFVYLVCGLTNDSMITVAPVFWCIMGTGLAANRMVKKMQKEQAEKAAKEITIE